LEEGIVTNLTKAEAAAALKEAGIPRKSWTKSEWGARHGLSEGHARALFKSGRGPRVTDIEGCLRITDDAEREWLAERATASST
jgi:hypothetical protein